MHRIFILSPAHSGGERAKMLFNERAQFDLARRLRLKSVPIGEVFSFLSGLYFRGKMAYAKGFAKPPEDLPGAFVITTNCGLIDADALVDLKRLQSFSTVEIDENEPRYYRPLLRTAKQIAEKMKDDAEVVLLGSIATGKYVEPLRKVFGDRLRFPAEFVGRGDMSRGGLMLRCAADNIELTYISLSGATRHGKVPPKLPPRRYPKTSAT